MAESISKTVHHKRASNLLGIYVGQSEKNIARAFHEASAEGAILFLDEADGFFRDREHAFQSWEVTVPNEFLTQMESFDGLVVCCTNRLLSLDPAVLRRFAWKVEFRPLTQEGRLLLFRKYFCSENEPLKEGILQRLEGMDGLTAGDYNAVHSFLQRIGSCEQRQAQAIESLDRERQYRAGKNERTIGFSTGEAK